MAEAGVVPDDGYASGADDGAHERGSASGDGEVDEGVEAEQEVEGGAVGGIDEGDGAGDVVFGEGGPHGVDDGAIGVGGFLSATEDDGVAGAETERGGVAGDIGSALVDHEDDADGDAAFFEADSAGEDAAFDEAADGVGLVGDLIDGGGHGFDALRVEPEPVAHGGAEGGGPAHILGVGFENGGGLAAEVGGDPAEDESAAGGGHGAERFFGAVGPDRDGSALFFEGGVGSGRDHGPTVRVTEKRMVDLEEVNLAESGRGERIPPRS